MVKSFVAALFAAALLVSPVVNAEEVAAEAVVTEEVAAEAVDLSCDVAETEEVEACPAAEEAAVDGEAAPAEEVAE